MYSEPGTVMKNTTHGHVEIDLHQPLVSDPSPNITCRVSDESAFSPASWTLSVVTGALVYRSVMAAEGASSQHAGQEQVEGLGTVQGLDDFVNGDVEVNEPNKGSRWSEEDWRQWNEGRWPPRGNQWDQIESYGESSDPWARWQNHQYSRSWGSQWWDKPNHRGDYSDPPAWGGWSHYRLWKRSLDRWNQNTDVMVWRRSEKVLKTFDWDIQSKLDHISDHDLQSADYLKHIYAVLDVLAGEKETSEKRRTVRAALYEGPRRNDESLSQYSLRREAQFTSAAKYVEIPDDLKAFMLEEQAGLSKQNLQNLRSLTGGAADYSKVIKALQILDTEDEPIMRSKNTFFGDHTSEASFPLDDEARDGTSCSGDEDSMDDTEIHAFLYTVMRDELDEDQAMSYLAEWQNKKRSWSENKALKNARKKDRRHFEEPSTRPSRPTSFRGKMSIAELKKVTKCANCGQKGHWREDCVLPHRPKQDKNNQGSSRSPPSSLPNAFVFLGTSAASPSGASWWSFPEWCNFFNCLVIPPGHAVVDPGASQDLIGKQSFEKLKTELAKVGLKPVILDEPPQPALGIGGKAKSLFTALTPCFLGKFPGVVRLTVLDEDIPHLLSIGLLEHGKAVIDTDTNQVRFKAFGAEANMTRLESGHRVLNIVDGAQPFQVPSQVLAEYKLSPDAFLFNTPSSDCRAYIADGVSPRAGSWDFEWHDHRISLFVSKNSCCSHDFMFSRQEGSGRPWITKGVFSVEHHSVWYSNKILKQDENAGTIGSESFAVEPMSVKQTRNVSLNHVDSLSSAASHDTCQLFILSTCPTDRFTGFEVASTTAELCKDLTKSWNHGRLPDSRHMLRLFFACFLCSHLSHEGPAASSEAGRHWPPTKDAQRERERVLPEPMVSFGQHPAPHDKGALQSEDASALGNGEVQAPGGASGGGCQSVRHLDAVPSVQDSPNIHPVRARQSETSEEVAEQLEAAFLPTFHLWAEETQGLQEDRQEKYQDVNQEQINNAAETQELQEALSPRRNGSVGDDRKQETINNAVETPELQEAEDPHAKSVFANQGKGNNESKLGKILAKNLPGKISLISCGPGSGPPSVSSVPRAMVSGSHKKYKVCELFSLPRLSALDVPDLEFTNPPNFDARSGWNFFCASDRAKFWKCLREEKPDLVLMSPICKPFSILMHSNWSRMKPDEVRRIQTEGLTMLNFCFQVAQFQLDAGRHFWLEQPATASSLATHGAKCLLDQVGVFLAQFDQCAAGLSVAYDMLSKKPTSCITNHVGLIVELSKLQCSRDHKHIQLQGGLPLKAQDYPDGLVHALLRGIRWWCERSLTKSFFAGVNEEDILDHEQCVGEDEIDDDLKVISAPQTPSPVKLKPVEISSRQKEMIFKLHANTGHLPVNQMLAMLKAAGARDEVMKYVKDEFHCVQCAKQRRPIPHKHASFPKTFAFNKIVGIDYFFIAFQNKTHAFLNVVCQGTNFQQVALLPNYSGGPPCAKDTWSLFCKLWLSPFGLPEVLLCDQGSEFKGHFERSLEQFGVMQSVTDSAAPWQNGRVERHGAWLKQRLEDEVQSGQTIVQSSVELEMLAAMTVAHKNRWFHRGGFSPYQLVFGVNPRIPFELLSDDQMIIPAIADASIDPYMADTPAAEFARAHTIRQKARELCVNSNLKDKVRLSLAHQQHQQREWASGQWVYVWRKLPGTGGGHMTRSRWVGPGLVIMQHKHSVWVSMRSRIWKCSSDQLRAASHLESLGAELVGSEALRDILTQVKSKQAGAVDVESEGPPEHGAWDVTVSPSHEECPAISSQDSSPEALPPIPEEGSSEPSIQPQPLIRDFLPVVPAPETPATPGRREPMPRQASTMTQEEPLGEPVPSNPGAVRPSTAPSDEEAKRRRTSSHSSDHSQDRKRAAEVEQVRLEREALRELRRLAREDRQLGRAPSSSAASASQTQRDISARAEEHVSEPLQESSASEPVEQDDGLLSFFALKTSEDGTCFMAAPAKTTEFDMRKANAEERVGFEGSDRDEWEAILKMSAAKVLSVEESKAVRERCPERVISSRMIRRKKPMPGVGSFKYKSRWCLHGHQDPDTGEFEVFSPMPSTEAITMFFQLCLNLGLRVSFLDIKNAFCQADKLDRPKGKIYASPCDGLNVSKDQLVEIIAPIYGLDDSPLRWHRTLQSFFESLGFSRTLTEPCWLVKRENGKVIAQVLIEVDDLNIGCSAEYMPILQKALENRFVFGKWETDTADFAGRHVSVLPNKVVMHQEKYILEKLFPIPLQKGRLSDRSAPLTAEEFETFRSFLYRVNWVGHQTRPEACGVVSILASRLKSATVHDVVCLNKLIVHLRSTASQPLTLHKFDNDKMTLVAASDAGGVDSLPPSRSSEGLMQDNIQGAWIIMATDRIPSASTKAKVSILTWRSAKLKRRVSSTLASEALAFSQALGELEWLQVMFRDVVYGDVCRSDWTSTLLPFVGILKNDGELHKRLCPDDRLDQCGITDAKSLFDSLKKENPTSRQDRRTSVEIAIIIESMRRSKSLLRWSPHPRMVADALTKDDLSKSNGALEDLFRTSSLALWDEADELARRKENPSSKSRSKRASGEFRESCFNLLLEGSGALDSDGNVCEGAPCSMGNRPRGFEICARHHFFMPESG
eukprot:s37_g47.t1